MRYVPEGWRRSAPKPQRAAHVNKKAPIARLTLPAAIERDIARLNVLLPTWPSSFIDLNAARNYVRQLCYELYFEYTGHADIEMYKFKLYVHFNAAKYAHKAEKFVLSEEGEARRAAGSRRVKNSERPVSRGSDETLTEDKTGMFCVSTAAYGRPADRDEEVVMPVEAEKLETVDTQEDDGAGTADQLVEFEGDFLLDDQDAVTAQICGEEMEALVREKDDPFKVCSSTIVVVCNCAMLTECCRICLLR